MAVPFLQEEICPGGLGALWEQQPRAGFPRISAPKGNQKCHLCQAPSPWPFTATAQRLQSCWNGFSPNLCEAQTLFSPSHLPFCSFPRRSRLSRPSICSSHLSQLVCASFKTIFCYAFQLLFPLVATPVLSSCCLFRTAVLAPSPSPPWCAWAWPASFWSWCC